MVKEIDDRRKLTEGGYCKNCHGKILKKIHGGVVLIVKSVKFYTDGDKIEARCVCGNIVSVKL